MQERCESLKKTRSRLNARRFSSFSQTMAARCINTAATWRRTESRNSARRTCNEPAIFLTKDTRTAYTKGAHCRLRSSTRQRDNLRASELRVLSTLWTGFPPFYNWRRFRRKICQRSWTEYRSWPSWTEFVRCRLLGENSSTDSSTRTVSKMVTFE